MKLESSSTDKSIAWVKRIRVAHGQTLELSAHSIKKSTRTALSFTKVIRARSDDLKNPIPIYEEYIHVGACFEVVCFTAVLCSAERRGDKFWATPGRSPGLAFLAQPERA